MSKKFEQYAGYSVPVFDPQKPEAFKSLSYKDTHWLRDNDSAAHDKYGKSVAAYEKWDAANTKAMCQKRHPVLEPGKATTYSDWDELTRIKLMTTLGEALKAKGFTITWKTGAFSGDYEVHKTWATYAEIYKDGNRVGDFRIWRPSSGYNYNAIGWVIRTNRGVGNPNARSSFSREEKRLKKLESAVKYITETAVPELSYEVEIKKAKKTIDQLQIEISNISRAIEQAKAGKSGMYSTDGLLKSLLEMHKVGDDRGITKALDERTTRIDTLRGEYSKLKERLRVIREKQLEPLLEKAKIDMPEFY